MEKNILFFLILIPSFLSAQIQINRSKNEIKLSFENEKKPIITETDTTLQLKINEPDNKPTIIVYHFDKNGKCDSEQRIAGSEICFSKNLDKVLSIKKYHWKKINENQYISDFPSKVMIEISPENKDWAFTILRVDWTKQLYDMLTGN